VFSTKLAYSTTKVLKAFLVWVLHFILATNNLSLTPMKPCQLQLTDIQLFVKAIPLTNQIESLGIYLG
jgi:hypothetical protein